MPMIAQACTFFGDIAADLATRRRRPQPLRDPLRRARIMRAEACRVDELGFVGVRRLHLRSDRAVQRVGRRPSLGREGVVTAFYGNPRQLFATFAAKF